MKDRKPARVGLALAPCRSVHSKTARRRAAALPGCKSSDLSLLNRFEAGNKTEGKPLMDFANGEILFQCLRLIGSGVELGRLLIAAERQGMVQVLPSAISGPQALRRRRLAEATPPRFRLWRNPLAVNGPATEFLKTL